MSVVAATSAVLTAVVPAVVGLASSEHLPAPALAGIAIAIPAIGLVCAQPAGRSDRAQRSGVTYGLLAGLGFAVLFIALNRAGTGAGAWPLLPGQAVSVLLVTPFALRSLCRSGRPSRVAGALAVTAGLLSGMANLLFLAATGGGELAVVAVLSSLYPAITVVLACVVLDERWSRLQAAGLLTAAAAIVLVGIG